MWKALVPSLGILTMLAAPAYAGAGGPAVGSIWGIIIIIIAAIIGFVIAWMIKKK